MARYWLGPYEWDATDASRPFWRPPAQTVGSIDLRSLPQCAATATPQGFGLFVTPDAVNLGSSYENLGTNPLGNWNAQTRNRWRSALGLPSPLTASNLRGAIWETLTIQSDPLGDSRAKPLVPTGSEYQLWLAAGRLQTKRFALADPEATPLLDMLKREYRTLRQQSLDGLHRDRFGNVDPLKYRKILGGLVRKYGIDYRNFQPADVPDEEPLTPETTITDNFNRIDADALGSSSEGWSWTEVNGDTDIVTNQARGFSAGSRNRAESDLSSSDHYCQCTMVDGSGVGSGSGPMARYATAADTAYFFLSDGSRIFKVVVGSLTQLTSTISDPANGSVLKFEVNGSALEAFDDTVSVASVTDTAIAGGTRCGLYIDSAKNSDDWSAEDLAAGGLSIPIAAYHYNHHLGSMQS